jgi:hypothetical protein
MFNFTSSSWCWTLPRCWVSRPTASSRRAGDTAPKKESTHARTSSWPLWEEDTICFSCDLQWDRFVVELAALTTGARVRIEEFSILPVFLTSEASWGFWIDSLLCVRYTYKYVGWRKLCLYIQVQFICESMCPVMRPTIHVMCSLS